MPDDVDNKDTIQNNTIKDKPYILFVMEIFR